MNEQFHEGQEVEVKCGHIDKPTKGPVWCGAKIVRVQSTEFVVEFPDGARGVFDVEHIRGRIW